MLIILKYRLDTIFSARTESNCHKHVSYALVDWNPSIDFLLFAFCLFRKSDYYNRFMANPTQADRTVGFATNCIESEVGVIFLPYYHDAYLE
jgi:hypothetical protein